MSIFQNTVLFCGTVFLFHSALAPAAEAHSPGITEPILQITYIANEGVLISAGDTKLLIDAHHYAGNPVYERVHPLRLEKVVNELRPFDGINLILATHLHADHFDAATVGQHLLLNSRAHFVGSEQLTSLIRDNYPKYDLIAPQVETVTPEVGFFHEGEFNGVKLKLLGMKHGGKRSNDLLNTSFLITVDKFKLLHIGDADGSIENFEPFKLPQEGIDIALLPYWFLTHEPLQRIVNEFIQPGKIVAFHIPPKEAEEITEKIISFYPGATVFNRPLQKIEF